LIASNVEKASIEALSAAGSILFSDMSSAGTAGSQGVVPDAPVNPRDRNFAIFPGSVAHSSNEVSVLKAVTSIAVGNIPCAVVRGSPVDVSQAASWTGVSSYSSLKNLQDSEVICATDCETVANTLAKLRNSGTSDVNQEQSSNTLQGFKIAVLISSGVLEPGLKSESSVKFSMEAAVSVFEKLGAKCEKLKVTTASALTSEAVSGMDLFLCPASATAAIRRDDDDSSNRNALRKGIELPDVLKTDCVCLPCGLVADEDDGYGQVNEMADREGMPVGMLLISVKKGGTGDASNTNTNSDDGNFSTPAALRAALAYESVTRWSSEVFAAGKTRDDAKEDMDDAREAFGIYFVSTLMKYLGKRTQ
jgi:hypothetical protein